MRGAALLGRKPECLEVRFHPFAEPPPNDRYWRKGDPQGSRP
jgi:hypothetical protein